LSKYYPELVYEKKRAKDNNSNVRIEMVLFIK
jgi:hypothetical protein